MAKDDDIRRSLVRFRYLTVIIGAIAVVVVGKMLMVMFAERNYWQTVSSYMVVWNKTVEARRGNILSDEGLLMASSMPQYRIYFDFKSGERVEKLRQMDQNRKDTLYANYLKTTAAAMHRLFPSISESRFIEYYRTGYTRKSHYYALMPDGRALSYNQYKEAVNTVPWLATRYDGWFYSKTGTVARKKPFGQLAARTLGDLYGAKDSARYGLELSFDSLLRGKPGIGHEERIRNTVRLVVEEEQIDGCDIVTTLNVQMQDVAETALRKELEAVNAISGVAVLMEVGTGDIKAMTSLTRTESGGYAEIQNNVVKEIYEPGSTFKTVSMMVAIDAGRLSIYDSVDCEMGEYRGFGGVRMTDSHKLGMCSTVEVLKESSNIGTSKLISKAFKGHEQEFVEGIYKTGINTHFDMQLSGTAAPVIRKDGYWDATRLPWMSFGYNVQLPVINTLAFYNGIANDGKMLAPRLVTEVRRDGRAVEKFPVKTVVKEMCKESTLKDIKYMLEQVVIDGTGKSVASQYFNVAGKTGTAQLAQGSGGYKNNGVRYLASFCGYFPAERPMYSCIVAIRTSTSYGAGATLAGPVFHEISEKVMAMSAYRELSQAVDTVHAHLPVVLNGDLEKAESVLRKLGMKSFIQSDLSSDSAWGTVKSANDTILFKSGKYDNGLVPNVIGMGASDAVFMLESAGLRVSASGRGRVVSQSLSPGSRFNKGNSISIKLGVRQ